MSLLSDPPAVSLWRNRSFWALNVGQFLGAFNDNLFKELVLLLCVDRVKAQGGMDLQAVASMLFAGPFLLLSGVAGMLSDKISKRTVLIGCKAAEIGIVLTGMAALATGQIWSPLLVLGLFGVHSAFFGPAKYGILPEILPRSDLARGNGIVLMATFLAIIGGLATAGAAVHLAERYWEDRLWLVSLLCLVVAVGGWWSARQIRPLPAAEPQLRFQPSGLFLTVDTARLLWRRPDLMGCVLASSTFWFAGGMVYPPAINRFGKQQLGLNDWWTAVLAASTGVGIAVGCVVGGWLSQTAVRAGVIRVGVWGLTACLSLLAIPGFGDDQALLGYHQAMAALIGVGVFAGLFSVPLQIYLQDQAPPEQKGRMIAALNLMNWIGIAASSAFYAACDLILQRMHWPPSALFGCAAAVLGALAMAYRPPNRLLAASLTPADA